MHHQRVQQEKKRLAQDIEKLKTLHREYEAKYQDLSSKYEAAMKEKMLIKLERDRLMAKSESLQKTVENVIQMSFQHINLLQLEDKINKDTLEKTAGEMDAKDKYASVQSKSQTKAKFTPFPEENRTNPYIHQTLDTFSTKSVTLKQAFKKVIISLFNKNSTLLGSYDGYQCFGNAS